MSNLENLYTNRREHNVSHRIIVNNYQLITHSSSNIVNKVNATKINLSYSQDLYFGDTTRPAYVDSAVELLYFQNDFFNNLNISYNTPYFNICDLSPIALKGAPATGYDSSSFSSINAQKPSIQKIDNVENIASLIQDKSKHAIT